MKKSIIFITCLILGVNAISYAFENNQIGIEIFGQSSPTASSPNRGSTVDDNNLNLSDGENYYGKVKGTHEGIIVSDPLNNRIMIWTDFSPNASASMVVGQDDFESNSPNKGGSPDGTTLNRPVDAFYEYGIFVVTDTENNRVLIWNNFPEDADDSADVVLGQEDFNSVQPNRGGSADADTLKRPYAAHYDGSLFYIADTGNNRVLMWNGLPSENGQPADVVIGQEDFTSTQCNKGSSNPDSDTLCNPKGVMSLLGGVFVADTDNNRVLLYFPFISNSAVIVYGQEDFTQKQPNRGGGPNRNTLKKPEDMMFNLDINTLFIADTGNNRVLVWEEFESTEAEVVIGQPNFTSNSENKGGSTSFSSLSHPTGIFAFLDEVIFVADAGNNRVIVFLSDGESDDDDDTDVDFGEKKSEPCNWTKPGKLDWIQFEPKIVDGVKGMELLWVQHDADKINIKIDDGTGNFPWMIEKTSNDGHEFLANVEDWQKIMIQPINHCKKGSYSMPVSKSEFPDGWYNLPKF